MIYVLSLTPCIDRTVSCEHFDLMKSNRVTPTRQDLGGKGVNCARTIRAMGGEVTLLGTDFNGAVSRAMAAEMPCFLTETGLDMRVNTKIFDKSLMKTIEVNERAVPLTECVLESVLQNTKARLQSGDTLVLCGSLPTGADADTYARFAGAANEKGANVLADCSGDALKTVIREKVKLIKPNRNEMDELCGEDDAADYAEKCRALIEKSGVEGVLLSLGKDGSMLVTGNEVITCPPPDVTVRGDIGAGDAMTAAAALCLSRGTDGLTMIRYASAAAGAVLEKEGTQAPDKEDVERIYQTYLK